MAKQQSFADKIYKKKHVVQCPVCKDNLLPVIHMVSELKSDGVLKFRRKKVQVCKCNHAQVYGN